MRMAKAPVVARLTMGRIGRVEALTGVGGA